MKKIDELKNLLEEIDIELGDADLNGVLEVISKSKNRIDGVLSEPHPDDDQDIMTKLNDVSTSLGDAIALLSEIQGKVKNGK